MNDALTESRYFRDGMRPEGPVFALYDAISDCFLTVLPNRNVAIHLKYILSSRYHLHICRLDTAANYFDIRMSNGNCEQWTLSNRHDIKTGDPLSNNIIPVAELCATREEAQYDIVKEKLWCLFCAHCLYVINNERDFNNDRTFDNFYWQYSKSDDYLNGFLEITEVDYPHDIVIDAVKRKVLKLLYLGRDFEKIEEEIKKLVSFI